MRRRTWLGGTAAVLGAGALEWCSLQGNFDNRKPIGTSNTERWAESLRALEQVPSANCFVHLAHSTHLLVIDGIRILTDPWFHGPAFGSLTHAVLPPARPEGIGPLDAILISHDHPDHADLKALDRLDKRATVVVSDRGLEPKLRGLGFNAVLRISEWESGALSSLKLTATPALHDVPEVGYVIEGSKVTAYFAGDTALCDAHHAIGERWKPDVSILPVDGTRIRWEPLLVMDPAQALEAARRLGSRLLFPTHAETRYTDPLAEHVLSTSVSQAPAKFAALVQNELSSAEVKLPAPGELSPLA